MQKSILRPARLALCLSLFGLGGCASPPKPPPPTIIQAAVDVRPSVNPDARGRPSPVVVRYYELKSLAAFNSADFFSLFERDKETLGAELVDREEFQLKPGDKREFEKKLQAGTHYVAVVAAFRDLEHAQWRATFAVVPEKVSPIAIRLEGSAVSISAR
jgi:type VI secretion system protein VasD